MAGSFEWVRRRDGELHTMTTQKIAVCEMDSLMLEAGLSKSGLFLMGNDRPSNAPGKVGWSYCWFKPGSDVPSAKVRALVDLVTGQVDAAIYPDGFDL